MIGQTRKKKDHKPPIQTDLTADWGGLACSASCNLPLKFNVPAPVIRDEKDYVFTQPPMGNESNLNYLLFANQRIFAAFFNNFLHKSKNVWQKEVVIQDMMVCATNGFQVPELLVL